jgi:hypothetical protein
VQASGQDKQQNATQVTDSSIVTNFFTYTFSGDAILATPKNTAYKYTIAGAYGQDIIICNTSDDSGKRICSALGKQVGTTSVYNIE